MISADAAALAAEALRAARGAGETHGPFRIPGAAKTAAAAAEALAWAAGVVHFRRSFTTTVRVDRTRTGAWRDAICVAAARVLERDVSVAARSQAVANFRRVRGPRQACKRCGAAFALLEDLAAHECSTRAASLASSTIGK